MANYNRVILMGNLTRDPELRYLPTGQAVTTFTVAINRRYTLQSGEKREETTFVRCVAWARIAEVCAEFLTKGSPVLVEGRLQSRSWESPQGEKRSTIEVVAQTVKFIGRREPEEGPQVRHEALEAASARGEPLPQEAGRSRSPEPSADLVPEVDLPATPEAVETKGSLSSPQTTQPPETDEEAPF